MAGRENARTAVLRRWAATVAATVALAAGGLAAPAGADVAPPATATIQGAIVPLAGTDVAGSVSLYRWDRVASRWRLVDARSVDDSTTYSFSSLEVGGEYTLVYAPLTYPSAGFAPGQALGGTFFDRETRLPAQVVTASAGTTTRNFPLSAGVVVSGSVSIPVGGSAPVKVRLARANYVHEGGRRVLDGVSVIDEVSTGSAGSFTFPRVVPGWEYSVYVVGASTGGPAGVEPVTLAPPYLPSASAALRRIDAPTVLPVMRLRPSVPVSGALVDPRGTPFGPADEVTLVEIDPAGGARDVATTDVDPSGAFSFAEGAFPGRRYTVRASTASGGSFYLGLTSDPRAALTFQAGSGGLTIPSQPALVDGGANATPWAEVDSVSLAGVPVVGGTLSVVRGDGRVGGTSPTAQASVEYHWYRDGELVAGATGPTYSPSHADLGHVLGALVVVRAPGHRSEVVELPQVLVGEGAAPYPTRYPSVSGTAKVGARLSVTKATWSVAGATVSYQWLRGGKKISGATKRTYTLTAKDKGKRISVRVTATAPGHANGVSVTPETAKVAAGDAPRATTRPTISGTAKVGKKITVSKGRWKPSGVTLRYQWLREGKKISGATKRTYRLTAKDRGARISVRVTASLSGHKKATVTTKALRVR